MYKDYEDQIRKIMADTEKEEAKSKNKDYLAPLAMFKLMVGAMSKYVEREASENEGFNAALSLEWKSAERMLKFVWKKAQELAVPGKYMGVNGAGCCLSDDVVFDWISDYYFLDDKEQVEKERAEAAKKKAEAEAKKKEEAEKLKRAREKALEKLSAEDGWNELSDEEKEKKITAEANKIKNRLGSKKTTEKKKTSKVDKALEGATKVCDDMAEKSEHTPGLPDNARILTPEEAKAELDEMNAEYEAKIVAEEKALEEATYEPIETVADEDGQFSLLNLMKPEV